MTDSFSLFYLAILVLLHSSATAKSFQLLPPLLPLSPAIKHSLEPPSANLPSRRRSMSPSVHVKSLPWLLLLLLLVLLAPCFLFNLSRLSILSTLLPWLPDLFWHWLTLKRLPMERLSALLLPGTLGLSLHRSQLVVVWSLQAWEGRFMLLSRQVEQHYQMTRSLLGIHLLLPKCVWEYG